MLIRTQEELDALPEGAIILDEPGLPWRKNHDHEWHRLGLYCAIGSRGTMNHAPFTLIHPRRYGADDVERVAKGLYERACEGRDYDSWEDAAEEARELYLRTARAALDALEEK